MTENTGVFGAPLGIGPTDDRSQFMVKPEVCQETQSIADLSGGSRPSGERRLNSAPVRGGGFGFRLSGDQGACGQARIRFYAFCASPKHPGPERYRAERPCVDVA